jgi:hypothetical protein
MARIIKHQAVTPDGYSNWVQPIRDGYRMFCCDCGLCHEFQFRLVPIGRGRGRKIQFRARRNNRSTAQKRRQR